VLASGFSVRRGSNLSHCNNGSSIADVRRLILMCSTREAAAHRLGTEALRTGLAEAGAAQEHGVAGRSARRSPPAATAPLWRSATLRTKGGTPGFAARRATAPAAVCFFLFSGVLLLIPEIGPDGRGYGWGDPWAVRLTMT
jgi:hypothetical protein